MSELTKIPTNRDETSVDPEVSSGRNVKEADIAHTALTGEQMIKLERSDIAPGHIGLGGTEIVLQRHGEYVGDREDPKAGSLTEDAAKIEAETAANYFNSLMAALHEPPGSRCDLRVAPRDSGWIGASGPLPSDCWLGAWISWRFWRL